MSEDLLRLILTATPTAGLLLFTARYVWRIQAVITARFEHVLQALRSDIVELERRNARLESLLAAEREARQADNDKCESSLRDLRRRLASITPPFGNPRTGEAS